MVFQILEGLLKFLKMLRFVVIWYLHFLSFSRSTRVPICMWILSHLPSTICTWQKLLQIFLSIAVARIGMFWGGAECWVSTFFLLTLLFTDRKKEEGTFHAKNNMLGALIWVKILNEIMLPWKSMVFSVVVPRGWFTFGHAAQLVEHLIYTYCLWHVMS